MRGFFLQSLLRNGEVHFLGVRLRLGLQAWMSAERRRVDSVARIASAVFASSRRPPFGVPD